MVPADRGARARSLSPGLCSGAEWGRSPPDRCFVTCIRQKAVTCSPSPQACLAPAGGICHGVPEPRSGPAFPSAAQGQVGGSPPPAKACAGRRGTASGVAQSRPISLTLPSTSPTSPRGLSRVSSLHVVAVCNVVLPHRLQGTSFLSRGHASRWTSAELAGAPRLASEGRDAYRAWGARQRRQSTNTSGSPVCPSLITPGKANPGQGNMDDTHRDC